MSPRASSPAPNGSPARNSCPASPGTPEEPQELSRHSGQGPLPLRQSSRPHIAELLAIAGDLPSVSKSEQIRAQHTFTLWPGSAERLCQKQPLVWAVLI